MQKFTLIKSLSAIVFFLVVIIYSCSKGGDGNTPDPCAGVTITVSGTVSNPTANGGNNGSIIASASGSSGFTFSINGTSFQSSGTFSGLVAGTYTITVKNSDGCTGSSVFTVTDPPSLCSGVNIAVTGTINNPSSGTATDGSIAATAAGSTGFTYSLNGGTSQASGTFTGLTAGSYFVTAKDANGCTGSAIFTLTAPNSCMGVTITVNNTVTANTPCESANGKIILNASGGVAPYTYSLNGGTFQSSNIFANLTAANYTVTAKDANGCTGTSTTAITDLAAGPLFNIVKSLVQTNCVSCHNNTIANGGMNWTVDCNIVTFKDRIKARAVDGNPSPMPEGGLLPASERQKITNWINAGGKYTD